jgi:benzoate-CoA ligase family protein
MAHPLGRIHAPSGALSSKAGAVENARGKTDKESPMNAADLLPAQFNVATWFVDRNVEEGRGGKPAFHCESRTLTYDDVLDLTNRTGNALAELGVGMEDRVLMLCLDAPEFIGTFWGAMKLGAVPVPVNTLMRSADYLYFLNDSRAKVAVVSSALLAELEPVLAQATFLRHVLVAGGRSARHPSWEDAVGKASSTLAAAPTSRDDAAFWLYSSGSTGFPKGAVHLHHDMVICTETYAKQVLGLRESDRVFSAAKLFFAYGLGNAGYFPMGVGAESVLYSPRPTPDAVFEVLATHRPTIFFGVPTLYAGMLAVKDAERRWDLSSLRLCVSAGEALPDEIYARWRERFGVEIIDGIGTTEILHIFLSNRPGSARPGSTGLEVPGYEAIIVDETGAPVKRGEIGNLRVKGDSTMAFYWNKHDKTRETLWGSWIQTGDKYHQDEDGYFWYAGRADDMLKVGGIWVSPVEVEATLVRHPAVLEAAVVGKEDEERLVKPKAFVVLKEPSTASPGLGDELKAFVKDKIAPYKYPRWVEFLDELPKTATGKIQRFKLRD